MGVTDWILLATIGAILWYSWETRCMKKEMVKQTELRIRPQLIVYLDEKGQYFNIMNVGNGTAMNVAVINYLPVIMNMKEQKVTLVFDKINYIMPGQERRLIYRAYNSRNRRIEEDTAQMFMGHLVEQYANKNYLLHINYANIEGTTYSSKVQCGKGGIKLLETKKLGKQ